MVDNYHGIDSFLLKTAQDPEELILKELKDVNNPLPQALKEERQRAEKENKPLQIEQRSELKDFAKQVGLPPNIISDWLKKKWTEYKVKEERSKRFPKIEAPEDESRVKKKKKKIPYGGQIRDALFKNLEFAQWLVADPDERLKPDYLANAKEFAEFMAKAKFPDKAVNTILQSLPKVFKNRKKELVKKLQEAKPKEKEKPKEEATPEETKPKEEEIDVKVKFEPKKKEKEKKEEPEVTVEPIDDFSTYLTDYAANLGEAVVQDLASRGFEKAFSDFYLSQRKQRIKPKQIVKTINKAIKGLKKNKDLAQLVGDQIKNIINENKFFKQLGLEITAAEEDQRVSRIVSAYLEKQ